MKLNPEHMSDRQLLREMAEMIEHVREVFSEDVLEVFDFDCYRADEVSREAKNREFR